MNDELILTCATSRNKRPTKTEAMRLEAARIIAQKMVRYGVLEEKDVEDSAADIVKTTWHDADDGYKIARALENQFHWDCDMQIAELCGEFGSELDRIYDVAEKKWAEENPAEPAFAGGDQVTWRGKPATVRGVYERQPQCYKLWNEDISRPDSYYIVHFEDVNPSAASAPA